MPAGAPRWIERPLRVFVDARSSKRGFLRPERLLFVSPRLWAAFGKEDRASFTVEVAEPSVLFSSEIRAQSAENRAGE
jgi:hypothetical protein